MKKIIFALAVILIAMLACSSSGGTSSDNSSSEEERLKQCLDITKIVIVPDHTITEVQGWVENNCGVNIYAIKVVATGSEYPGGPAIGSDEEYIEDLAPNDTKYFEALISDPNQEIKAARVVIDEVFQP